VNRHAVLFGLALAILVGVSLAQEQPERSKGISMRMLPKKVADNGGGRGGLVVAYAPYLKPEREQPVIQSAEQFVAYVSKQDQDVQQNGVWILVTHPDAYSADEKALLEKIKAESRKKKIIVFVSRAADLPNGWKRVE
jgi:hypothetical protein